jgi:phage tail sheath protein FI
MATYKTPGVYVEELSTLPPSVAEVSTAVPAFIGYTAIGSSTVNSKMVPVIKRINTMLDYETYFGKAKDSAFSIVSSGTDIGTITRTQPDFEFLLYASLSLYFKNGGGSCYIVSIGSYTGTPAKQNFLDGLSALSKEDEPTLIVLTDAVSLPAADYHEVCVEALKQCHDLGDRFSILDVLNRPVSDSDVQNFRNGIASPYLMYGAAYYPYLQTSLTYSYTEDQVTIQSATATWQSSFTAKGIIIKYTGASSDMPKVGLVPGVANDPLTFTTTDTKVLTISGVNGKTGAAIATAWATWKATSTNKTQGFDISQDGDGSAVVLASAEAGLTPAAATILSSLKTSNTAQYNQIKSALSQQRITLPPSAAIAGIYASVDRDRGVWKAPANVPLAAVIGPVIKISQRDQDNMNIDENTGKSVNAIRAFAGKGTLVWGARTLAGNDNEWRYVSVRRLFIMIEESSQKATSFAVFEPNDATTWLKVKAMIESYLYGLWQQGALAGATPEDAYFVDVGLGKTMRSQDVLEGRMIVKIGVAAVRPAEFIILTFMHKLQQS